MSLEVFINETGVIRCQCSLNEHRIPATPYIAGLRVSNNVQTYSKHGDTFKYLPDKVNLCHPVSSRAKSHYFWWTSMDPGANEHLIVAPRWRDGLLACYGVHTEVIVFEMIPECCDGRKWMNPSESFAWFARMFFSADNRVQIVIWDHFYEQET